MADNVIHGEGKPRFVLPTSTFLGAGYTVSSSSATTVVISGSPDLTVIDTSIGLRGLGCWTKNSDGEDTWGIIQSYDDDTDTLTVDSWSNGLPHAGEIVEIKGRYIDLPYCQRLTEGFDPDYITKKMLNGRIKYIKRGFYYKATLDYSRYLHKDEMQIIRYLFEVNMNGCGFFPRRDNTLVFYSVDIEPQSDITFYQLQNHQGHGGVTINIRGIERLSRIPFDDPIETAVDAMADDTDTYVTDDRGTYITGG